MTILGKETIEEVDLDAILPCSILVKGNCPNEAEWIQYLDCGATSHPACTPHKEHWESIYGKFPDWKGLCTLQHYHEFGELKWRRL